MKFTTIEGNVLIGLNTQEALLLLRILQASQLQGPCSQELQSGGDAEQFVKDLTKSLLQPSALPITSGRAECHEGA